MTAVPIGTMVRANGGKALGRLAELQHIGFECYQYHWWAEIHDENLQELAKRSKDQLANLPGPPFISSLALYGNPLRNDAEGESARHSIRQLFSHAEKFGTNIVGCFTGRISGTPWKESLPRFAEVFGELCREAADYGVRIAFENCPMDGNRVSGDWNLAFDPWCWEQLFNALPTVSNKVIGLEWEPAHQILQGHEPVSQLKNWLHRVFHIHGKDARRSPARSTIPGNGDTNWTDIFAILDAANYKGSIDIEGYHDADWSGHRELDGQKNALEYLRGCREKRFIGVRKCQDP